MSRRVVVIGGGASGTAAAHAATKAGAHVTIVVGGPGATSLSSGALDDTAAARGLRSAERGHPTSDEVASLSAFVAALGIWEVGEGECRVATIAGLLRSARGRDLSVLDLQKIENGTVGVVDVLRRGWDANGLAQAWTREPWAREHDLRFDAVKIAALRHVDDQVIPLADLAALHDDPERVGWLVERLRESSLLSDKRAIVLGPWLGLGSGVAAEISRRVGKPVGEPLSAPGGVAGLRFERARDALFAKAAIAPIYDTATNVRTDDAGASVELESGGEIAADAIVIAIGGVAGGGIEWSPATAPAGFISSLKHPGSLAQRGRALTPSGSPEGALFENFSWSGESVPTGIERVGIWTDPDLRVRCADGKQVPRLYAGGDVVADAPRTILAAIRSGLRAGARAALTSSG